MIREEIETEFDPSDTDKSAMLADSCGKVLLIASRALWAEHQGMRMGRDDSSELFVACQEMASRLGILPRRTTGKDSDELWRRLRMEAGLPE